MPTDTDPNLPSVDSPTAATPPVVRDFSDAFYPRSMHQGDHDYPAAPSPVVATRHDPVGEIAEEPDPPVDPATLTTAEWLHFMNCDCGDVDNTDEHDGWDFHVLAAAWEARAVTDAIRAGVVTARAPVEAKVKAGGWATLAASVGLALAVLLADRLDWITMTFGGKYVWVVPAVVVLDRILPAIIGTLKAYNAPHTPRVTP